MTSDSRLVRTPPAATSAYVPDLPDDDWQNIRAFVVQAAQDAVPHLTYPEASVVNAIAHHVDWCVNVAGYALAREVVFRRDIIAAGTAMMYTTQSSTRGRRRSLMLRVGEALSIIPRVPQLTPLSAAVPSAPYTLDEIDGISRWALEQLDHKILPARVIVALGLGAGLPPRDLWLVRPSDVLSSGQAIQLADRTVPVSVDWQDELNELVSLSANPSAPLFRPTIAGSKNMVTNFVASCADNGMRPSVQRMRATWLVEHLATGTPMQDLLAAAGLQSMDALVRYERFLPPPSPVVREGMSR